MDRQTLEPVTSRRVWIVARRADAGRKRSRSSHRGDPPVSRLAPPWNEPAFGSLCGQTDGVHPQSPLTLRPFKSPADNRGALLLQTEQRKSPAILKGNRGKGFRRVNQEEDTGVFRFTVRWYACRARTANVGQSNDGAEANHPPNRSATPKTANCVAGHIVQRERRQCCNRHCRGNGASHEHDEPQHNRRPFESLAALE